MSTEQCVSAPQDELIHDVGELPVALRPERLLLLGGPRLTARQDGALVLTPEVGRAPEGPRVAETNHGVELCGHTWKSRQGIARGGGVRLQDCRLRPCESGICIGRVVLECGGVPLEF